MYPKEWRDAIRRRSEAAKGGVEKPPAALSWTAILRHWDVLEMDFQDHHHIDLGDDTYWDNRTWAWMRLRIIALLTADTRLARVLRVQTE